MKKKFLSVFAFFVIATLNSFALQKPSLQEVQPSGLKDLTAQESLQLQYVATAEQLGVDIEIVKEVMTFQDAFSNYADKLYDKYAEKISYIRLEPMPTKVGIIQFVGAAPEEVFSSAKGRLLEEGEIVILEDGEFSFEENVMRAELSAEALKDLGYKNHLVYFDSTQERIRLEVNLDAQKKRPDMNRIVEAVQARLDGIQAKSAVSLGIVDASDFELEIGKGVIKFDAQVIGGLYIYGTTSQRACTAGFTIVKPGGTKGFLTAGHCYGMNRISSWTGDHATQRRADYFNNSQKRDLEWHTVNGAQILPKFQSSACCMTTQTGWQQTATMKGKYVCRYGKRTNYMSCGHYVSDVGAVGTVDGTSVSKLAIAQNRTSQPGDSGGPVFVGGKAFGTTTGNDGGTRWFYTQIQAAINAFGIDILR